MAVNPTQNGIAPLRGLNRMLNPTPQDLEYARLQQEYATTRKGINPSFRPDVGSFTEEQHFEPGTPGYERGLSKYDDKNDVLNIPTSFDELNQNRYDNQSAWDVAANGIIKAVGRTATSFINSMVGGITGALTAAYNLGTGEDDWWKGFWNNPLSNAMADVDDWFNENFVNYQSLSQQQNSRNGEWWKNLGSLNMWMDDVVTNTGFTLGMIGASMTGAGLLGAASKAMQNVGLVQKYGAQAAKAITLLNSTAGEAATEALSAQREYTKAEGQRINDYYDNQINSDARVQELDMRYQQTLAALDQRFGYQRNNPQYQRYRQQLDQQYQQQRGQLAAQYNQHRQDALAQMEDDGNNLGLAVGLGNMAILGISNFNLAGRFVDNAYRNAVKSAGKSYAAQDAEIAMKNAFGQNNVIGNATEGYRSRSFLGNVSKRATKNILSEGVYEEMGQGALSAGAKSYYSYEDVDNYWRARLDPDSVDRTADGSHDFLRAVGNGLKETYGSAEGWKEGFIGGITGMAFSMGETRDEWRNTRFAKRAAKDLNNALADPKLQTQLQHFVAQSFHAAEKDKYAADGNQSDWKTEDDKSMFSLVSTFRRAGKMDDLHEMLKQESEKMDKMSDDDLNKLISDSTKVISVDEQKAADKQAVTDDINKRIEALLKDGATIEDINSARQSIEQAKQAEAEALNSAQLAEQEAQLIQRDPRARQFEENGARNRSRQATARVQKATRARKKAEQALNDMFADGRSINDVNTLLAEQNQKLQDIDNAEYTELYDGPFVDPDGNRMTVSQVHEQLQHNVDRMRKNIEHYQEAVEEVNRRTRGLFGKDQEDYLAYNWFLDKTHLDRRDELVKKWRNVLPEQFTMQVPKGKAKRLAKALGISESSVQEDPDNEGQAIINTKDMTDEQFTMFVSDGLLGQKHLSKVDAEGNRLEESTQRYREQLRDDALSAVEGEVVRTGKRKDFNRDEFLHDMEDARKAHDKATNFRRAYNEALSDPESILTAKQKWMRKLQRSWERKKAKLMQKRMSIQQLGDLTEDQMKELDDYHYILAKAEKMRRAVSEFWNGKVPSIYEQIEDAFDTVKDPALRQELINRVKARIDEFVLRMQEQGTDEVEYIETVEADEVNNLLVMLDMDEILPDDDPLWSRIDDDTKRDIKKGFSNLKRLANRIKTLIMMSGVITDTLRKRFDRVKAAVSDTASGINVSSTVDAIKSVVKDALKKNLTEDNIKKLMEHVKTIEDKIAQLKESAKPGAKKAIDALMKLLSDANRSINDYRSAKKQDTEHAEATPPPKQRPASTPKQRRAQPMQVDKNDVAGSEKTQHLQNPSLEDEEVVMSLHEDIGIDDYVPSDIWQSVTGESARRSNFTYKPYHEIVDEELDKHPELKDEDILYIAALGNKGSKHTVADWRKYSKRSKIVHNRLKKAGAFSYIDSGKVKAGDEIGFMLSKVDGVFIVYLTHKGNIIGDLNDPEYGAERVSALSELYAKLKEEYGNNTGEIKSKYTTHASNIYAGFMHYAEKDADGNVPTRTVASFGAAADDMQFFVAGVSNPTQDIRDIIGHGVAGQPFVLVPTPANDGMTRRHAVPVSTQPFNADSQELEVIKALLASDLTTKEKQVFLNHFLNCKRTFIKEHVQTEVFRQLGQSSTLENATEITVVTRGVHNGAETRARILITEGDNPKIILQGNDGLRANVSFALLNGVQGVPSYESIAKNNPELPQSYNDFLKGICHTQLSDPSVHNSWITVNRLFFDKDGNVKETREAVQGHNSFEQRGIGTTVIRDPILGESYRITFGRSSDDKLQPNVLSIEISSNGHPFYSQGMGEATKERMLPVIAKAVLDIEGWKEGETRKFMLNGIVYEFSPTSTSVGAVTVAKNQPRAKNLDSGLSRAFSKIAAHFDGTDEALDNIIKDWFVKDSVRKGTDLYDALKQILMAIKDNRKSEVFSGISNRIKVDLLNSKRPVTAEQKRGKDIAMALAKRLGGLVSIDQKEGQRLLDMWRRGEVTSNFQAFLTNNGKTVYGFAYKGKIYLDPDIIQPEALIHEYTHLWTNILRASNNPAHKQMWETLKDELKQNPVWGRVVKTYTWLKTDDEIADEVFAKISGQNGDRWLRDEVFKEHNKADSSISDSEAIGNIAQRLRNTFQKLIDYIKSAVLGINPEARTFADMMQQMVWNDMLSDNPLSNFDKTASEDAVEEKAPAQEVDSDKPNGFAVSSYRCLNGDITEVLEDIEYDGGTVSEYNGEHYFTLPSGKTLEDYGIVPNNDSIQPMLELEEQHVNSDIINAVSNGRFAYPISDSASSFIDRLERSQLRHYMGTDDFFTAAELVLSEQQRTQLWKAMSGYMNTKGLQRYEIAAHMQHLFNRYMNDGYVGHEELDVLFKQLQTGIDGLLSNRTEFIDSVSSASSASVQISAPMDAISNLNNNERRLAHSASLDMLSGQDVEFLKLAGYSKDTYLSLSEKNKEAIRKCIL